MCLRQLSSRSASPLSLVLELIMETSAWGLALFLTLDVLATFALALWLASRNRLKPSHWDQPMRRNGAASCAQ